MSRIAPAVNSILHWAHGLSAWQLCNGRKANLQVTRWLQRAPAPITCNYTTRYTCDGHNPSTCRETSQQTGLGQGCLEPTGHAAAAPAAPGGLGEAGTVRLDGGSPPAARSRRRVAVVYSRNEPHQAGPGVTPPSPDTGRQRYQGSERAASPASHRQTRRPPVGKKEGVGSNQETGGAPMSQIF
jgi:hypothetical protein